MSGITGLGNGTSTAASTASATTQTPLQRALAMAQAAAQNGKASSVNSMALARSALGAELASALNASDDTSYGNAFSLSSSLFGTADTADTALPNIVDQVGSFYPSGQWQQMQTPNGVTPGQSRTVPLAAQLSYGQVVKPSDETASHAAPNLGTIATNSGRLVLLGSLPSDHTQTQSYSFHLAQPGQLRVLAPDPNSTDPTASLGSVHMQLYDSSGSLVADSDPKSGEPYLTYVKLDQTVLPGADFHSGNYTVKLSYDSDAAANAKGDYSLFIESGTDPGRVSFYTMTDTLGKNASNGSSSGLSVVA